MDTNYQILIVDDEPDIRKVLGILLRSKGYSVITAVNGAEAVEAVKKDSTFDLIIMDIMMPEMTGTEACEIIRGFSTAPVLFLTAKTKEDDKAHAYQLGGDDYLGKPFSQAELLMKVESLIRRYRIYSGKTSSHAGKETLRGNITVDVAERSVVKNSEEIDLTETEWKIFCFLLKNRGQAYDARSIFEGVWGEKFMSSDVNTITVHILNLRKKLEDDPASPKTIRTVWGKGYQIDKIQ